MAYENPSHPGTKASEIGKAPSSESQPPQKRIDIRHNVDTTAFVTVSSLPAKAYAVKEISRGGMSLSFRDSSSTRLELEQYGVERGDPVEMAFVVRLNDTKNRFNVRARVVRITRQGIAVEFLTHNPPQLAALRELFAPAQDGAA